MMKSILRFLFVAAVLCLMATAAVAQSEEPNPTPIPLPEAKILEGIDELKGKSDRNHDGIKDVQTGLNIVHGDLAARIDDVFVKPANPISKTWVAVKLYVRQGPAERAGRPAIISYEGSRLFILNPGLYAANVACIILDVDGGGVIRRGDFTIEPGALGTCGIGLPGPDQSLSSWAVVHSDQYLLVDGADFSWGSSWSQNREGMLKVYPIDCSDDRGIGFLCESVNQVQP